MMTSGDHIGTDEALRVGPRRRDRRRRPRGRPPSPSPQKVRRRERGRCARSATATTRSPTRRGNAELFAEFRDVDRPQVPRLPRARGHHPVRRGRRRTCPSRRACKVERELFMELMTGPSRRRSATLLRRARGRPRSPTSPRTRRSCEIKTGGVLGAGTMGGGIAMNFANVGIPVTIVETRRTRSTAASASSARTTSARPRRADHARGRRESAWR